ncbi:hypothetical protein C5167_041856 [Papaver somniferum]|nr:hypothetical protein C5167_041856 [Papaver somniferum]
MNNRFIKLDIVNTYSMQLNASRVKVLQAPDNLVSSTKDATAKELLKVSDGYRYRSITIFISRVYLGLSQSIGYTEWILSKEGSRILPNGFLVVKFPGRSVFKEAFKRYLAIQMKLN